jgi:glycosyltransferase involved in cell wall biosynthesis
MLKKILGITRKAYFLAGNRLLKRDVYYVSENFDWVIRKEGEYITKNLRKNGINSCITFTDSGIFDSILHFGSINVFNPVKGRINIPHQSNRVVVTYYHVVPGDRRVEDLASLDKYVHLWHTASSITAGEIARHGVSPDKIVILPLGIDLRLFRPMDAQEKNRLRHKLGIPEKSFLIGSFQKDGVGWKEGLEPKLIKGPDIFCEVVEKLNKKYPIFVLLTAPARGYVKERLKNLKVPFKHIYSSYSDLPKLYGLLDLYLVTSRVEGLPKAVLECMATHVPFVATRVGIVPDVVKDQCNGLIAEIGDVSGLVSKASILIEDHSLRQRLKLNMSKDIPSYSWDKMILSFNDKIYSRLKNA